MFTAFRHPAANRAIERAAVVCRQILEQHALRPQMSVLGDAAFDTLRPIYELQEHGYLDETESRIAAQIAQVAMHCDGWRPLCLKRNLGAEARWEAEIIAAARRIKPLVARQATMFDAEENEGVPNLDQRTARTLVQAYADDESELPVLCLPCPTEKAAKAAAERAAKAHPDCFVFAGTTLVHNPRLGQELVSA